MVTPIIQAVNFSFVAQSPIFERGRGRKRRRGNEGGGEGEGGGGRGEKEEEPGEMSFGREERSSPINPSTLFCSLFPSFSSSKEERWMVFKRSLRSFFRMVWSLLFSVRENISGEKGRERERERRKEGRKKGRKEERKKGRKEERKKGRKGEREKGRKEERGEPS